jgi:nicotinamidase-related amidase
MDLTLTPARTALVVIDLQRGVARMPTAPYAAGDVVAHTAALAAALREAVGTVVLVHVIRSADGRDALHPQVDKPVQQPGPHAADWTEIVPELGPEPGDLIIAKRQWGAFYGTELDLQLRRRGVDTILLAGISTNIGVESTARDAYERGYQQVFVEDAMGARDAGEHAHTVGIIFPRIGRVRSTADVLAALEAATRQA